MNRALLAGACVFVVALFARVVHPETNAFLPDQFRDVTTARSILAGEFVMRGPEIGGLKYLTLGPLQYYVVAAGLVPRDAPIDAFRLVALLNAIGVVLYYFLFRRITGDRVAVVAAAFLAIGPLGVMNARMLWNVWLVVPSTALFFTGLWSWSAERRRGGFGLMLVGAALMLHAHLLTVTLWPIALVGFVRRGPLLNYKTLAGAFAAAALTLPWLIPQIVQVAEVGFGSVSTAMATAPDSTFLRAPATTIIWRLLAPETIFADYLGYEGTGRTVLVSVAFCIGLLVIVGIVTALERRSLTLSAMLLAGIGIPFAALFTFRHSLFAHYLDVLVPLRALAFGFGVAALARTIRRGPSIAIAVILIAAITVPYAAHVRDAAESGILRVRRHAYDLSRFVPDVGLTRQPTMGARERVGRRLALDLGIVPETLQQRVWGPWPLEFLADIGFWMREPIHRGGRAAPIVDPATPVLILHRDDPYPRPSATQRVATLSAGAFEVIPFRTGLDLEGWQFQVPGVNAEDEWIPLRKTEGVRHLPAIPHAIGRIRTRLRVPNPPPRRIAIHFLRPRGYYWAEIEIDGKPLKPLGDWSGDGHRPSMAVVWDSPQPGDHRLVLTAAAPAENLRISLEIHDVWLD